MDGGNTGSNKELVGRETDSNKEPVGGETDSDEKESYSIATDSDELDLQSYGY